MADRPLTDRQQKVLRQMIANDRACIVHLATWEWAAVLGWTEHMTATVLRQLRGRKLVEYANREPDDAHYITRHKITMAGLQAVEASWTRAQTKGVTTSGK